MSRPVRVLIVSPSFGAYGGIEAFVFAVGDLLRSDRRFDVRIAFKRTSRFLLQPDLLRACDTSAVEFVDRASVALLKAIGWADVVHTQNAPPDVTLMSRVLGKPVAVTIHDFLPAGPRLRRLSWLLGARAASVRWYNSRPVWESWEPDGARPASQRVPTISALPSAFVDPFRRQGLVFVGRLVDSKGVDTLLDAYAASGLDCERWPLTIVGDGPLRRALEQRGAAIRGVRFTGFVDQDAKAAIVSAAKWLVAPSRAHEGLGLVVIEARHMGVPCIVTRHGGLPEAAGQSALMCEPDDVEMLAAQLRRAAAMSDDEYERRGAATKADLASELVPLSFYADAYLRLANGHA